MPRTKLLALEAEPLAGRENHEAGRALLARLVRQLTGEDPPPILTEARGKPYFAHGDLHFSISHTKGHVFCALADGPVGLDAEELSRRPSPRLAQRILSPNELRQYGAAADKDRALLTFWVLKEAAVKLTGEGLRGYPNDTDFSLDDPRVREMDGCLVAVMTEAPVPPPVRP